MAESYRQCWFCHWLPIWWRRKTFCLSHALSSSRPTMLPSFHTKVVFKCLPLKTTFAENLIKSNSSRFSAILGQVWRESQILVKIVGNTHFSDRSVQIWLLGGCRGGSRPISMWFPPGNLPQPASKCTGERIYFSASKLPVKLRQIVEKNAFITFLRTW